MHIISGERLQSLADVYIGDWSNFVQDTISVKNKNIYDFEIDGDLFDNPRNVFCYGDMINNISKYIHIFKNPFNLISHNSDFNITKTRETDLIVNCPNLIRWYGQNVDYMHSKIQFLPIGIANIKWEHGNLSFFNNLVNIKKENNVYMHFNVSTNFNKRYHCKEILIRKGVPFLPYVSPELNIKRLQTYKYCICPEGNGLDTHRLWEAYYVKTVPILLRCTFSENIKKTTGLPMILLDSWDDFKYDELPEYEKFDFINTEYNLSVKKYYELLL